MFLEQSVNKSHDFLKANVHKPYDECQYKGSNQHYDRTFRQLFSCRPTDFVNQFAVRFLDVFYKFHISVIYYLTKILNSVTNLAPMSAVHNKTGVIDVKWKLFCNIARKAGIEPTLTVLETALLPLEDFRKKPS